MYVSRLLEIIMNNSGIPDDWVNATIVPIPNSVSKSVINNFMSVNFTSVIGKVMERIISDYLQKNWEEKRLIHSNQREFRKGYWCESNLIYVCQDLSDKLIMAVELMR